MSRFLKACRGEAVDATPIWLMRQAGRYQPEYREIRSKVSFVELCKTPDLAAEVTVLAARQLKADAAIIFADILLILEPLGVPFAFEKGDGPKILAPVRDKAAIDAIHPEPDVKTELGYVLEAIRKVRAELTEVPLIGFAGAPFTLASYAVEGGGSKNYYETKKIMYGDPGLWHALMEKLTAATGRYLLAQVEAGAQCLQLFDSWAGCLGVETYREFVAPHMKRLVETLGDAVPVIHFGTGNPALYPEISAAGASVLGVDWRVPIRDMADTFKKPVMGNLDPAYLLAPQDVMIAEAKRICDTMRGHPGHIFNLGHGIMPQASVPQVQALVEAVHEHTSS